MFDSSSSDRESGWLAEDGSCSLVSLGGKKETTDVWIVSFLHALCKVFEQMWSAYRVCPHFTDEALEAQRS